MIDKTLFTTEAQAEKYDRLIDKKFIRVDPETKKPHENSKDFFYEIVHTYPAYMGHGVETAFRTQFEVNKLWRNKTYKVTPPMGSKSQAEIVKHESYIEKNSHGDTIRVGVQTFDAEDFVLQFKEDTTI